MTDKKMKIGAHTVQLSHLDKVLFPDDGLTKGDLIDYYQRIADIMLPHLANHPLSMQRFPNGIQAEGFYQKEIPDYFPGATTSKRSFTWPTRPVSPCIPG
ncbi:MAG: hypothetical protein BroJett011_59810 [Chloroflexota bacterium]|nr:MAG: hypothetical protein BroJett011_59810 [Chloroflexota bacterium]